jgi:hypothetical protein
MRILLRCDQAIALHACNEGLVLGKCASLRHQCRIHRPAGSSMGGHFGDGVQKGSRNTLGGLDLLFRHIECLCEYGNTPQRGGPDGWKERVEGLPRVSGTVLQLVPYLLGRARPTRCSNRSGRAGMRGAQKLSHAEQT